MRESLVVLARRDEGIPNRARLLELPIGCRRCAAGGGSPLECHGVGLLVGHVAGFELARLPQRLHAFGGHVVVEVDLAERCQGDRKSTRLNSSHITISYAVFCLKKKKKKYKVTTIKKKKKKKKY